MWSLQTSGAHPLALGTPEKEQEEFKIRLTKVYKTQRTFNSPIFEPELDVLLLEPRELVPVGLRVEVVGVARDERLRGVRVPQEPLLQPRDLRHCGQWTVGLHIIEDGSVYRDRQIHKPQVPRMRG